MVRLDAREDFEELIDFLNLKDCFSTYNLMRPENRRFKKVQFFAHPFSPGEGDQKAVSILIGQNDWEIYLYGDGSWCLM